MATKKRASPKPKPKAAAQTVDSQTVRLMIVCFTLLSLVFAVLAFWRYG
ncbi:MAG TPA: hypothetical protein VLH86_02510 [Patescibacteria group bacterium]|nr:hypothetical protein [Patescibacteria group bacterium]